jgi:hypothetical protein
MRRDLEKVYIPSCTDCLHNKSSTRKPTGPLHPLPIPDECGNSVAIDFIGPLPMDEGHDCILTMTDRLGSDIRIIPTNTTITAKDLALIFFSNTGTVKMACHAISFLTVINCSYQNFGRHFTISLVSNSNSHLRITRRPTALVNVRTKP